MAKGYVGSNGTDQKVRQRRSSPPCLEKNIGGVSTLEPVDGFQSKGRYRDGRDGRRRVKGSSSSSSSSRRSSLLIGISVVIMGIILSLVVIAAVARHYSSSSSSSTGGKCTENHHINGISGNLYTWCYKNKTDNNNQGRILSDKISGSTTSSSGVERIIRDKSGKDVSGEPKKILAAIDAHEYLHLGDIVNKDQDELCYADLTRLGYVDPDDHRSSYSQPVIGPCHYDDILNTRPKRGYNEGIDFPFFRDADEIKFTDKIRCMLECVDRVMVGRDEGPSNEENILREKVEFPIERSMEELQPKDKVAVDDVMLIEAAKAGMLLVAEKLMVKHGLNPLYRPVQNEPGSSRSLNAIQEAIRGGYAEIVKVLTNGDNSMTIDDYDRSVEDYVKMKGSPIRPYDARNVLGIEVVEESASSQQRGKHRDSHGINSDKKSGWSETSATSFDHDRCDFDVIDGGLSAEVFYRDYFITGRPVAMRGQAPEMELDMFSRKSWQKLEKFNPNTLFEVGPTAYPPLTDQELCSEKMSINAMEKGAVCEAMPEKKMIHALHPRPSDFEELYSRYDGDILDPRGGFRTIKNWFPLVETRRDLTWQVFFGGDLSGATYHWHEAAFNILYVGIKQWKIGPPLYRGITGMPAEKVSEVLDEKMTLTCVQQPGDMLYIPNFWGHSTLNHGFTIGAAAIIGDYYYQMGGGTLRGESNSNDDESESDSENEAVQQQRTHGNNEEEEEEEEKIPFLFVHINKTGGTSLIRMFEERCDEEYYGDEWWDENENYHRAFHATAHAYIDYYGRKTWNDAYTFAVVRHPLARQVSNFFFLASSCQKNADKCEERLIPTLNLGSMSDEEKMDAFHEWILKVYKTYPPDTANHYRFGAAGHGNEVYNTFSSTQTSWLVDPDGKMVVKEIFHLEDLSNDISKLAENIPCLKSGQLEMDHSNKTPNYPDYMLFAKNKQTRSIINEVFAEDFKILGYKPV
jgi:hypothetical protein